MKHHILPAIRLTLVFLVLFCGVYTMALWGVAQFAPGQGNGFKMPTPGSRAYYVQIGQSFTSDKYFWPRPSAVHYNAAGSGASNKGPSNPEYLDVVQNRMDTFMVHNPGIAKTAIPSDLVTASASGIDPDISMEAALVQVERIARARQIPEQVLVNLVHQNLEKPLLGVFGTLRINVLKLNLALDNIK